MLSHIVRLFSILVLAAVSTLAAAQSSAPTNFSTYFTAITKKGQPAVVTLDGMEAGPGVKIKSVESLGSVPISYILAVDLSSSTREHFAAQQKLAEEILTKVVRPQVDIGFP